MCAGIGFCRPAGASLPLHSIFLSHFVILIEVRNALMDVHRPARCAEMRGSHHDNRCPLAHVLHGFVLIGCPCAVNALDGTNTASSIKRENRDFLQHSTSFCVDAGIADCDCIQQQKSLALPDASALLRQQDCSGGALCHAASRGSSNLTIGPLLQCKQKEMQQGD